MNRRGVLLGVGAWAGGASGAAAQTVPATDFQVLGPFYPIDRSGEHDLDMTRLRGRRQRAAGRVVELSGRVLNARGQPVNGAEIEIWQANAVGRYAHPSDLNPNPLDPNFQGYARLRTGRDGSYRIITVKPEGYAVPGTPVVRTPHIHFDVAGRADRLVTQMYFPDEQQRNAVDPLLNRSPNARTVIAQAADAREAGAVGLTWDIILPTG